MMRHYYVCAVLILNLLAAAGVNAGPLARIYIVPSDVSLVAGAQQQFQVIGEDADGNEVAVTSPVTWINSSLSTLSSDGLFTASNIPGKIGIRASLSGIPEARANVEVMPFEARDGYLLERIIGSLDAGRLNGPLDVTSGGDNIYVLTEQTVTKWTQSETPVSTFYLTDPVTDAELAVDSSGNVFVLDKARVRIQKYGPAGSLAGQWGSLGSANGQFDAPKGIAIDGSDRIYVADGNNKRIQVFNTDGSFVTAWAVSARSRYWPYDYVPESPLALTIDSTGRTCVTVTYDYDYSIHPQLLEYSSQGQLLSSYEADGYYGGDIAVDKNKYLYVVDNDAVTRYEPNYSSADSAWYEPMDVWGYSGRDDGMFDGARGIAISSNNIIYVADYGNCRVQAFRTGGELTDSWYSAGCLKGQLKYPSAVSIDAQGNVLVGDSGNYRVQAFNADGTFIREFGSRRAKDGPFACTGGIASGPNGTTYVTDATFSRILGYNSSGALVSNWPLPAGANGQMGAYGITYNPAGYFYVTDPNSDSVITLSTSGAVVGTWGSGMDMPVGVTVDLQGMNLVTDYGNNRIQRFNGSVLVNGWGTAGTAPGQFQGPAGACADWQDNVYVADSGNCRIQKFNATGAYLGQLGSKGFGPYDLLCPEAVAVDGRGNIYVADTQNHRIKKYVLYKAISTVEAKRYGDGVPAEISGAVVTAAFDGFFYIEADNRSSGVRVNKANHGMSVGMRANVTGTCSTLEGERCIDAATVVQAGSGNVEPVALSNKALGGGNWNYDSAKGTGQRGVTGGQGLNNIGLLVRAVGRVTHSDNGYFYIDDGSGLDDGLGAGVRVLVNGFAPPPEGAYVQATGISACYDMLGGLKRLVRARSAADVKVLDGGLISGTVIQNGGGVVPALVESAHPYTNNFDYTWTITGPPSATSIRVHFSQIETEYSHDYLYLLSGAGVQQAKYNTAQATYDYWSKWVTGNTIKLRLTSDAAGTRYGFRVDQYEVQGASVPAAGVTLTVAPGGQSTVTDANGNYQLMIPLAGYYNVAPSLAGATFTPASRSVFVNQGETTAGVDFIKD